jgi:hypothetical protein
MIGGEALGVRRLDAAFTVYVDRIITLKRRRQAAALQGALRVLVNLPKIYLPGSAQWKLAASLMSPLPLYLDTFG